MNIKELAKAGQQITELGADPVAIPECCWVCASFKNVEKPTVSPDVTSWECAKGHIVFDYMVFAIPALCDDEDHFTLKDDLNAFKAALEREDS